MYGIGSGAGVAALGFWLFIAAIVVAGVWDTIRKRDAQHETLRRVIESGQPIDDELTDKLLLLTGGNKDLERDLRVGAAIMIFIAPGLAVFGWFMSYLAEELMYILLGVSALVALIGIGLFVASYIVKRWYRDDDGTDRQRRSA